MRRLLTVACLLSFLALAVPPAPAVVHAGARIAAQAAAPPAANTRAWIEKRAEIEAYLKTAEVVRTEGTNVGVMHPVHAFLAPGGPIDSMMWKAIKPGMYSGFHESYLSEIAGYEMDKFLDLGMVPPTVEREIKGAVGAAVMFVPQTKNFKEAGGMPTPPPIQQDRWNRQVMRTKMFDNLIGNIDPNLGNWLVDPNWNIILIDHSRAFVSEQKMPHTIEHVDAAVWEKLAALDEAALTGVLKTLVEPREIRAMLQRRDQMKKQIEQLVKKNGEAAVFMK
ncbi:MAG: hypothetical protein HY047_13875 [Acidobacteria bacterium]|nr:hypothetical protein [Acidobacteriota bacterium]